MNRYPGGVLSRRNDYLLIALVSAVLFIPFLGDVHLFDWDEINFAECAREMIVTGDYLRVSIDYEPFWEKPPLFFWLQAGAMHIFGVGEFAARLPNALAGITVMLLLYFWGTKYFGRNFGFFWMLAYAGSLLPHLYFKSGILDPLFNLFMILSVMLLYQYYHEDRPLKYLLYAAASAGLAVLVKGPVGLLLPGLSLFIYIVIKRKPLRHAAFDLIVYGLGALSVSLIWFGVEIIQNGTWFVEEFIRYQIRLLTTGDAGHSGPFYYHFIVLLIGCFPASMLIFKAMKKDADESDKLRDLKLWMFIVLTVVLAIFSIVETKIIHYSSLAYYPITFLAAMAITRILDGKKEWNIRNTVGTGIIALLLALLFLLLPMIGLFTESFLPYIKDEFVKANLEADVAWSYFDFLPGLLLLAGTAAALILLSTGKLKNGFITLFAVTGLTLYITLPMILPKVETYSQGAPIGWYEYYADEDVYIKAVGFRTYADLFYSRKPYQLSAAAQGVPHSEWQDWLMEGPIERTVYFVTKMQEFYQWEDNPDFEVVERKNGFILFRREPPAACSRPGETGQTNQAPSSEGNAEVTP